MRKEQSVVFPKKEILKTQLWMCFGLVSFGLVWFGFAEFHLVWYHMVLYCFVSIGALQRYA